MENTEVYNLRVLYIEDEIDTLEPMVRFLRRRFASVTTANEGEEGWRKFNEINPDLIITDLLMPGFNGIDLIRKIRESGYVNPIVITSALQDVESIIKTVDLGISKYIIKPIDLAGFDADLEKIGAEIMAKTKKNFDISIDQKKEYESAIRYSMSSILKKYSGKGPRDVKVFIGSDRIEVTCLSVRTAFEETLFQKGKNTAMVEQGRRLFYQILKDEIEKEASRLTKTRVIISEIYVNANMDADIIKLVGS